MSQPSSRALTPEDLLRFKTIPEAQISPDGRRIAYTLTTMDEAADEYRSHIWLVGVDGGDPVQFTHGSAQDHSPRWSPDGRWLAFLSTRDGKGDQLYVVPVDGGEARRLTSLPRKAGPAVWSPDGARIAFAAPTPKETAPEGQSNHPRWQQRPKVVTRAEYKDDGRGYTFDVAHQLYVIDLPHGEPRQITEGDWENLAPAWSPDGQTLAVSRSRTGRSDYMQADIWRINADGSDPRRLTDSVGRATSPSFSPDGAQIAFYGAPVAEPGFGEPHNLVWLVSADGGEPRALTLDSDRSVVMKKYPIATPPPIWSPDGQSVTAILSDRGNHHLVRVATSDNGLTRLITGERTVLGATISADDRRIAFAAGDLTHPSDIYTAAADGSAERRLTHVNRDLLEPLPWRAEKREFETPHGTIDGWLFLPVEADHPLPLLVDIHGGPHSYVSNVVSLGFYFRYVMASRGWAVLSLNPTGSGSYGREFAHAIRGRWGEHDLPEQLAVVDTLVAEGLADPDRLAVTGYSYGGYMTSWTITHTDRYKAAVVGAPVANLESFHGTSDIGPWFGAWQMRGDLVTHRETYRRLSPINYVERVTTPTLIVHGEADDRCPIGQGEELYIGLIAAGNVPTEFVRYPGGSHLFVTEGRPSHRVDYNRRIMEWVERHALGGAKSQRR